MDLAPSQAAHLGVPKSITAKAIRAAPTASAAWMMASTPPPNTIPHSAATGRA